MVAALTACDDQSAPSQGFAGLGSQAQNYAGVVPGRRFDFPADHGVHPGYRIEWWYVTANLEDEQGRPWGVQWTLFRNALQPGGSAAGWADSTVWMGHAGLTGPDGHRHGERFARGGVGQAGVDTAPFKAWIDDWQLAGQWPGSSDPLQLQMRASGQGFRYDLQLTSERPLVLQGDQGYSRKSGQGQASNYYSQPYLQARGSLELDGRTYQVKGQAWLDREWSSQPLAADQQGWDWFSLHLASGEKLMLFQLRHADGRHYRAGTWIDTNGVAQTLGEQEIRLTPLQQSAVAGRRLPTRWALSIPGKQLELLTEPVQEDAWMDTRFPYWEGPIRFSGSQQGVGYLEMTGY
ncbi:MAG: lipocalin-like domain-containing protein [Pseudomonas sp.]|uniref:lipocalin-like domain-containing protein n=1 Tax=Pseudomonas sp. TaxID=306 RepID=UPI0033992536